MANTDHDFEVRVLTEDGEVVLSDVDFDEEARWDWFSEVAKQHPGDVTQLIQGELVVAEEFNPISR